MAFTPPPLLAGIPAVTDLERAALRVKARSWLTLSRCIKQLTEEELLKIIKLEMEGEKRPIILTRALSRYRTVREKRENGEIFAYAGITKAVQAERKRER